MESILVDNTRYRPNQINSVLGQPLVKDVNIVKTQPLPLPHQQKAKDKWWESIREGKTKGALIMATASGKTNIAIWCIKDYLKLYGLKNVLFISHLEQIWSQTETRFKELFPEISCGFYVGDRKDGGNTGVTIASVFTLYNAIKNNNIPFSKDHFKFIVIDEFHHTATSMYQKVLKYFNPDILLGMSCLKERNDNQKFLHYFGDNIIYELDTVTAICEGAIAGLKYYAIKDDIDYKVNKNRFKYNEFDQNRRLILPEKDKKVVGKWMELASGKKTIVFCATIEHANRMAEYFNEKGISAVAIHHHYCGGIKSTPKTMEERTNGFRNGKYLVACTIDKWLEGADFPDAEVALLMRPTRSWRIFLQSRGRVLRLYNGKKFGIVIDAVGNHKWVKIYKNLVKEHITYELRRIKEANPKAELKIMGKDVIVTDITNSFVDSLQDNELGNMYEEVKKKFSKAYNPGRKKEYYGSYKGSIEYEPGVFDLDIEEIKDILFKTGEVALTREHLIRDFLDLEKKLGRQPKCDEYNRLCHSCDVLNNVFGKPGWRNMLESISKKPMTERLTIEHLVADFYKLEQKLGRQPTYAEFKKECHTIINWGSFLKKIGRVTLKLRGISKEQVIGAYIKLKNRLGRQPSITDYERYCYNDTWVIKHFGSWGKMVNELGGNYVKRYCRGLTKEHLIDDYLKLESKLGRQPSMSEYSNSCHSSETVTKYFGSYANMLKEVGREPLWVKRDVSPKYIVSCYKELEKKLGRQPKRSEFEDAYFSVGVIKRVFGCGWTKMLKKMGIEPLVSKNLHKEHLIKDYIELENQNGRPPIKSEYKTKCHCLSVVNNCFGKNGWSKLVKAAAKYKYRNKRGRHNGR
jgi:superfamily II DNA or RNA helicase